MHIPTAGRLLRLSAGVAAAATLMLSAAGCRSLSSGTVKEHAPASPAAAGATGYGPPHDTKWIASTS